MSLTTYWLSRAPGQEPEGPFSLGQLQRMHAAGSVTAESQVCLVNGETWVSLDAELEALAPVAVVQTPVPGEPSVEQTAWLQMEYDARKKSAAMAIVLSVFLPMGGQFYLGKYGYALVGLLMMLTIVMFPIAWIASMVDAERGARAYNAALYRRLQRQAQFPS